MDAEKLDIYYDVGQHYTLEPANGRMMGGPYSGQHFRLTVLETLFAMAENTRRPFQITLDLDTCTGVTSSWLENALEPFGETLRRAGRDPNEYVKIVSPGRPHRAERARYYLDGGRSDPDSAPRAEVEKVGAFRYFTMKVDNFVPTNVFPAMVCVSSISGLIRAWEDPGLSTAATYALTFLHVLAVFFGVFRIARNHMAVHEPDSEAAKEDSEAKMAFLEQFDLRMREKMGTARSVR